MKRLFFFACRPDLGYFVGRFCLRKKWDTRFGTASANHGYHCTFRLDIYQIRGKAIRFKTLEIHYTKNAIVLVNSSFLIHFRR